ncbi:MAG: polysaccharide biosynthesis protein [Gemmatimonadetes bacterium]|nr:polysaccharide biosynthesis protein [Gemmatimonadota bacterium]
MLPATHLTPVRVPLLVLFATSLISFAIIGTPRLKMRVSGWRSLRRQMKTDRRVLIADAGVAGEAVVRELRANPDLGMEPVGFVDDDLQRHGMRLGGIPVLGPLNVLSALISRMGAADVLIAMPRAAGPVVRQVLRIACDAGARTQIVPGLFEILSERVSVTAIREVQIEDLLRRDVIQTDLKLVERMAACRTVLVTRAGGSIGSELCRQLAPLNPDTLVVLGHGENPIFDLTEELSHRVLDLARDVICLSGLEEGVDINIEFTGIRPGEKLYEEMFFSHEVAEPTSHSKILRARTGVGQYSALRRSRGTSTDRARARTRRCCAA